MVPMLLADPQIFEPVLSAFLLVTLVAAAMSSLDSVLLIVASTCHRDIFELFKRSGSEEAAVRNTGLYVLVFAIITALVALDPPGEIVTLTAFSGSVYAACFFPGLFFGLYWRPGNGKALTTSFIVGLASLMLWSQWDIWPAVHEVFPAFILSITAYVTVALITEPVSSRRWTDSLTCINSGRSFSLPILMAVHDAVSKTPHLLRESQRWNTRLCSTGRPGGSPLCGRRKIFRSRGLPTHPTTTLVTVS